MKEADTKPAKGLLIARSPFRLVMSQMLELYNVDARTGVPQYEREMVEIGHFLRKAVGVYKLLGCGRWLIWIRWLKVSHRLCITDRAGRGSTNFQEADNKYLSRNVAVIRGKS